MAKIEPSEMIYDLLYIIRKGKNSVEKVLKAGIGLKEAEALQAKTIEKNAEAFEKLQAERRELEESPDSPEKRGKIKAVENKMEELMHPSPNSTFAIRRDYEAEAKARNQGKAGK